MNTDTLLSVWMLTAVGVLVTAMQVHIRFRAVVPHVALGLAWQLQARLAVATWMPGMVPANNGWHDVSLAWLVGSSAASAVLAGLLVGRTTMPRAVIALAILEAAGVVALSGSMRAAFVPSTVFFIALLTIAVAPATSLLFDTALARNIGRRSLLQGIAVAGLLVFVLPDVILRGSGGQWPDAGALALRLPVLLPGAALYAWAAYEFARRGGGTPYPFDPPVRLVTSGPYAVVANPMQIAICLCLLGMGVVTRSAPVGLAAAGALFQYIVFANACSGYSTLGLTAEFKAYRSRVRAWRPRIAPRLGIPDGLLAATDAPRDDRHPVRGLRSFTMIR